MRRAPGEPTSGPTSQKLNDSIKAAVAALPHVERPRRPTRRCPADAVTSSASGLDPHISLANALIQSARVAKARGPAGRRVQALVAADTEGRDLGVLGEPGVNVLRLNIALDQAGRKMTRKCTCTRTSTATSCGPIVIVALAGLLVGMALGQLGANRDAGRSRIDWPAPKVPQPRSLGP